jgi:hypothetical protein
MCLKDSRLKDNLRSNLKDNKEEEMAKKIDMNDYKKK